MFVSGRSCLHLVVLLLISLENSKGFSKSQSQQEISIRNILERVQVEKPVETLLILTRLHDWSCPLGQVNSLGLATLRLEENTIFDVHKLFNSEALAVVCMSKLADIQLLSTLAENLDRMRQSRILLLLQTKHRAHLEAFQRIICQEADKFYFVNLLLLHSTLNGLESFRMQPFPNASFWPMLDLNKEELFPRKWYDFKGRQAMILTDLIPPRSFMLDDQRTGEQKLCGCGDRFVSELAKKRNIKLKQLMPPLGHMSYIDINQVYELTSQGLIDLPLRGISHVWNEVPKHLELTNQLDMTSTLILIPCDTEMRSGNFCYKLQTYFVIIFCSYFMFAIVETGVIFVSNCIYQRRSHIPICDLVMNLRVVAGVLGLPTYLSRLSKSNISLRLFFIVMSLSGLVFGCVFNGSLSTQLTIHTHKSIRSLKELQDSGMEVLYDTGQQRIIKGHVGVEAFEKLLPKGKCLPTHLLMYNLLNLNTSYAYVTHEGVWFIINGYQKSHNLKALCHNKEIHLEVISSFSTVIKKNSVFREALMDFTLDSDAFGLSKHWKRSAGSLMMKIVHSYAPKPIPTNLEGNSKSLQEYDFEWLWKLLVLCYMVACLVFGVELCMSILQRRTRRKVVIREFIP